jgi:hypothetical protein
VRLVDQKKLRRFLANREFFVIDFIRFSLPFSATLVLKRPIHVTN